jgi:regulator of nonsense transcripts 3
LEGTSANVTNSVVGTGGKKSKKGQPHVQAPAPVVEPPRAATAATNSSSKNTADGLVTESTKPVKAPRVPRVAPQNNNQSNNLNQGGTVDNAAAAPSEAPTRRTRPVIGLGSRQFEAALSGVGGRERRPKGEKGKEKESLAQASNDGPSNEVAPASSPITVPPSSGAGVAGSDEVEPLPSPKKERTRRGRGGSGGAPPVKISGILQRVDTAPSPAIEQGAGEGSIDAGINSTPVAATATTGVVGGGNRGGGRRGRGRGRGGHMKGVVPPTVKSGG